MRKKLALSRGVVLGAAGLLFATQGEVAALPEVRDVELQPLAA
jgi:hypothetical protein